MTRRDMWDEYQRLLSANGMTRIDGITTNTAKPELESAIQCLKATDGELDDYLTVFKLKYPNMYRTVTMHGREWKRHTFNRYYVYSTARMIIGRD